MSADQNILIQKRLDGVSLTALRVLLILNLLSEKSCSINDINEYLSLNIPDFKPLSSDTLCLYINTLRDAGCLIARPSKKNGFCYVLEYNPFKLNIDSVDASFLVSLKKIMAGCEDWKFITNADKLIDKVMECAAPSIKKYYQALKKSNLRDISSHQQPEFIELLERYCNKKKLLLIAYDSVENSNKIINIQAEKLSYENGAFYFWGHNPEMPELQCLRVDRIRDISIINDQNKKVSVKAYSVEYKLTGVALHTYMPKDGEEIVDESDTEIVIRAQVYSKFKFIQRALSYGYECEVVSPLSIRNEVISKLNAMLALYNKGSEQ